MRTSTIFAIASSIAAVSAADCAGPGDYDSKGRYSCNLAHQYPNGQTCKTIDGCPLLVDANGQPVVKSATTTNAGPTTTTSTCAPGGSYDSKGRYSCNPAHQYPSGVTCQFIDGCPLLVGSDGKVVTSSGTAPASTSTAPASKCAAPGERDSQGRYSCNPAHQYPDGQKCIERDGCYVLVAQPGSDTPPPATTQTKAPNPSPSDANCAAPGAYDSQGRYSCNPAHQYPNGQSCKVIDGCPLLVDGNGKPIVKPTTGGTAMPTTGPTTVPVITNGGSALKGGVALVAAVFAALI